MPRDLVGATARRGKRDFIECSLADGNRKVADGNYRVAITVCKVADGNHSLADGNRKVADGNRKVANTIYNLADGNRKVADGNRKVADGNRKVADVVRVSAGGEFFELNQNHALFCGCEVGANGLELKQGCRSGKIKKPAETNARRVKRNRRNQNSRLKAALLDAEINQPARLTAYLT